MKQFDSEQFHKDTQISRSDLETELCTNPSNLAYYIEQAALWSGAVERARLLRDNRGAEVWVELKDSGEKTTEKYIEAKVKLDPEYQKCGEVLRRAREQQALYEGAVEALSKKQFSLGSLNAMNRVEQDASTASMPTRSTAEERAERKARVLSNIA